MQITLPDHLTPSVRTALADAAASVRTHYGDRLHALVLYGSQARGDAGGQSDIDVLVVLDDGFRIYDEVRRLVDIELDLFDRHGLNVHLLPFERGRYADTGHPLMINVNAEGIPL